MNAFLFTWPDGDMTQRPVRLPKVGTAAMAVIDKPGTGPQFGPDGFKVPLTDGSERTVRPRRPVPVHAVHTWLAMSFGPRT